MASCQLKETRMTALPSAGASCLLHRSLEAVVPPWQVMHARDNDKGTSSTAHAATRKVVVACVWCLQGEAFVDGHFIGKLADTVPAESMSGRWSCILHGACLGQQLYCIAYDG